MNKESMNSDSPPDSMNPSTIKSNYSLAKNTKMIILPPNILQNICISDSIVKGDSIVPAIEFIKKKNNLNTVLTKEHKDYQTAKSIEDSTNLHTVTKTQMAVEVTKSKPIDDTNNETWINATKVPRLNRNEEKLLSKVNHMEQGKDNFHDQRKQNNNGKIDKSTTDSSKNQKNESKIESMTGNIEDSQSTSNNVSKSQGVDKRFKQHSNKKILDRNSENQKRTESKYEIDTNFLDRSKRIRKQTNFDDYITTYKKESFKKKNAILNQRRKGTPSREKREVINSSTMSATVETNDTINLKTFIKGEPDIKNKIDKTVIDSHIADTSNTPAVTRKSLPLNSSNVSGNFFTIQNNKDNRLQNSEDIISGTCIKIKSIKDTVEMNDKSGNEIHVGSTSTSLLKHTALKQNDFERNLRMERMEESSNRNRNLPCTENVEYVNSNTIENRNDIISHIATPINQNNTSQTSLAVPVVRKRGRPRKVSLPQQLSSTSNELEGNLETVQNINNVSIAETVVHSKRRNKKSYNVISNDGLSDDSSTETSVTNSYVVKKRGRPPGTTADRGEDRGKGRVRGRGKGRGRGRGRGRGSSYSILDTEYVPKLKGPTTTGKIKQENCTEITNTSRIPEIDPVTCAKCEMQIPIREWNSHKLLKHNNMCWIKGDEPMDFENDIKLLKKVLIAAHKERKGQLTCEKCGAIKRSTNGFISHMQFCGKSDEERQALLVKCPICDATMMPSSLEIHERSHRQSAQSKIKELELYTLDNEKVKRKAAEKAVAKILEFTELTKDNNSSSEKKLKLDASMLKHIIKMPEQRKTIPGVWKGIWRKELSTKGTVTCRQMGCTFTCSLFEEMCNHFSQCNFTPQERYICKICKFSTISDENMTEHVMKKHITLEETDKYSDFEEEIENGSSDEKSSYITKFLNKELMYKIGWTEPYFPTVRWTMEFEQKNYNLYLFEDHIPNHFTLLRDTDIIKYLPQLEVSMRMKTQLTKPEVLSNTEIPWKQWKRFEGGFDEGTATFFVGGPVWALAWLPIPSPMYSKEPHQYVAISTHPTMESEYTVGKAYLGANMIQIWNVGHLDHESDNKKEPALSYAVVHNNGTVWCLEWCPSGCYQDENLNNCQQENKIHSNLKRMGMLAAACSDGNVYIYSLPFPEELEFKNTKKNEWPIYHTDPVMTLIVNISIYDNNKQNWQCTKLSWSKEHGHNTIAAGFSNGYIALWDLTYKSPLSMQKRQSTWFINAFQHFYAHGNAVSTVILVPFNGAKYLASGSLDRAFKFWNLEDTSTPQNCIQKGIILDGAWMTHWPCAVICFDDALGYKHTNTYLIPLRGQECRYYPILATNSPTYALSVSDYANSIAHGTLAGEIITIFPHQLLSSREIEKAVQKRRKLSSYVKIVDLETKKGNKNDNTNEKKSKGYDYMPETYDECKNRFGVIFCDNLKSIERYVQSQSLHTEKLTAVPIEEYPFMSVNRISWNPNAWSYLWLVVGYQNGLVRLLSFKYMSMQRELKTWLPQHVEFMLKKTKLTT